MERQELSRMKQQFVASILFQVRRAAIELERQDVVHDEWRARRDLVEDCEAEYTVYRPWLELFRRSVFWRETIVTQEVADRQMFHLIAKEMTERRDMMAQRAALMSSLQPWNSIIRRSMKMCKACRKRAAAEKWSTLRLSCATEAPFIGGSLSTRQRMRQWMTSWPLHSERCRENGSNWHKSNYVLTAKKNFG